MEITENEMRDRYEHILLSLWSLVSIWKLMTCVLITDKLSIIQYVIVSLRNGMMIDVHIILFLYLCYIFCFLGHSFWIVFLFYIYLFRELEFF